MASTSVMSTGRCLLGRPRNAARVSSSVHSCRGSAVAAAAGARSAELLASPSAPAMSPATSLIVAAWSFECVAGPGENTAAHTTQVCKSQTPGPTPTRGVVSVSSQTNALFHHIRRPEIGRDVWCELAPAFTSPDVLSADIILSASSQGAVTSPPQPRMPRRAAPPANAAGTRCSTALA